MFNQIGVYIVSLFTKKTDSSNNVLRFRSLFGCNFKFENAIENIFNSESINILK